MNYSTGEISKINDQVQFICGGPKMVVIQIPTECELKNIKPPFYPSNHVRCSWFDKKHLFHTEWMKTDCLQLINRA